MYASMWVTGSRVLLSIACQALVFLTTYGCVAGGGGGAAQGAEQQPPGPAGDGPSAALVRKFAHPLSGSPGDYDPLLELVGDARFVLLGEATHGTRSR